MNIDDLESENLADISSKDIDTKEPIEKRCEKYFNTVINPYAFRVRKVGVKVNDRFIALNSGADTISEHTNPATQCINVAIQNVINGSYIANTSVSIRAKLNVNRKQGKFIGSFAAYGYLKDPDDYHKLVVDEEVSEVLKSIFKWFIEGKSVIGITKKLNALGIPKPSEYKCQKGFNYKRINKNNDGLWCDSTVRLILFALMYLKKRCFRLFKI